jgi:DNA-binding NarL/FixJ family response regulator
MIADDHVAVRAGVVRLIQGTEIEMVCQAETCEQTVEFALTCQPDILLLDLRLADSDGLLALEQIKLANPRLPVLIFSASEELKTMALARKMGALGFVVKGATRDELLKSIRRVAAGKSAWTPRQIRKVVCRSAAAALAAHDRNPLSPREMVVLGKVLEGLANEAIAENLQIDIETVKQHVKHILKKLYVEDRTQAALVALRSHLFDEAAPAE